MYSILISLAICLAASARLTVKSRQFLDHETAGTDTGISCTISQGCVGGDVASCINGKFIITQPCTGSTTCLTLPVNNSTTDSALFCSTTEIQTALFAEAFGGVENIPHD
ncbi:hypothetical protein B0H16DRAFT_1883311 [Mycena metata]|uniref:Uncharacterized protein n=1 Tax=Mycena metata TaxID=1033252 RepID=A0AAD7JI57_9AGAR|nr:hypothetical protein B0H16DRAFT_1883311 [Mycena metata]